jgi:hypothetical protein
VIFTSVTTPSVITSVIRVPLMKLDRTNHDIRAEQILRAHNEVEKQLGQSLTRHFEHCQNVTLSDNAAAVNEPTTHSDVESTGQVRPLLIERL